MDKSAQSGRASYIWAHKGQKVGPPSQSFRRLWQWVRHTHKHTYTPSVHQSVKAIIELLHHIGCVSFLSHRTYSYISSAQQCTFRRYTLENSACVLPHSYAGKPPVTVLKPAINISAADCMPEIIMCCWFEIQCWASTTLTFLPKMGMSVIWSVNKMLFRRMDQNGTDRPTDRQHHCINVPQTGRAA